MKKKVGLAVVVVACLLGPLTGPVVAQAPEWTPLGPLPRAVHSAVLDPITERMIVFGGVINPPSNTDILANFNDVWWLESSLAWTSVTTSGTPPQPRNGHSAVFDTGSNRMIVFGGGLGFSSPCTNEVWILDHASGLEIGGGTIVPAAPEWFQLATSGGPPAPRLRHAAVYDPGSNRMIVFGGNDCFQTNYGDVWVLTNANGLGGQPTWEQCSPSGPSPGPREDLQAVYDPGANRLVFFGGTNFAFFNDVWVLSNANCLGGDPVWTQLSPTGTPPEARGSNSAVYDSSTNRMTIFGGSNGRAVLGDAWVLSDANGEGAAGWEQLGPFSFFPEHRSVHTAVYKASTNQMIVFGGITNVSPVMFTNNVWVLQGANGLSGEPRRPRNAQQPRAPHHVAPWLTAVDRADRQ